MVVTLQATVSLSDFANGGWLLVLPAALFLYYAIVWLALGPEPQRGSVEVRYNAPEGLSPAAVRYLRIGGTDGRSVAAVIAQLAARGCAGIEPGKGSYTLTRLDAAESVAKSLAPEEARVLELLFEDGPTTTVKSGEPLSRYVLAIESPLQKKLEGIYFTRHAGYIMVGVLASMAAAMGMAVMVHTRETVPVTFLTMWFFFCALGLGAVVEGVVISAWRRALRGMGSVTNALPGAFVLALFGVVFAILLRILARGASPAYSLTLALLVLVNLGWAPWLKRMTLRGRQAFDGIEGFRLFLEKVDQDPMQRVNVPGESPKAAMDFLPYAIALEVREAWGDRFAEAFWATETMK